VRELRRNSDMIEFLILYLQKSFIYSYLLVCILACFGRPKHLGPAQRARCDKRPEVRPPFRRWSQQARTCSSPERRRGVDARLARDHQPLCFTRREDRASHRSG
jgi:hypothetical protein